MTLQSRLSDLITSIGADIKALMNRQTWQAVSWPNDNFAAYNPGLAMAYSASGYFPGLMIAYNASAQNGDWCAYRLLVSPGTWTMRVFYTTQSNLGIVNIEYSLDNGATWLVAKANLDLYTAANGTIYGLCVDIPSIVLPQGTSNILIRWRVVGKNASSSGYYFINGPIVMQRTA